MSISEKVLQRWDSIVNVMTGLGGSRDKAANVAVDTARRSFTQDELDALCRFDGYVGSWFDRLGYDATLQGWELRTGGRVVRDFEDEARELGLKGHMGEALKLAVKDGGSLILLVTEGGSKDLSKPLDLKKVTAIKAMHVFDGPEFQVHDWEGDYRSRNFRRPRTWTINPQASGDARDRDGRKRAHKSLFEDLRRVHHTRCIYIPGRRLSERLRQTKQNGKDDSYLEQTWDALKDQRSIDQGGAILAQEMKQDVIKVGGLEKMDGAAQGETLRDRMKTIAMSKGLLGVLLMGAEDDWISRTANATGYKDLKNGARAVWAAVTSQPETIAFGATPGGLNTDGEAGRKAWDRVVSNFQNTHLKCALEYVYAILIAAAANSGEETSEKWSVSFRPLGTLTLKEEAEVRNQNALTDKINITAGVYGPQHVRESRYGERGYQHEILPIDGDVQAAPSSALSGPQMTALQEAYKQVAGGNIEPKAGVALLVNGYNISESVAKSILGGAGATFTIDLEPPAPAGAAPGTPGGEG
jgi:phage-related protein (TIGR01555 family)